MHETFRLMYPDPRKMPISQGVGETTEADGEATKEVAPDDGGIADGDTSVQEATELDPKKKPDNYWQEGSDHWIFWKVRKTKGIPDFFNTTGGPIDPTKTLNGTRMFEVDSEEGYKIELDDKFYTEGKVKNKHTKAQLEEWKLIEE